MSDWRTRLVVYYKDDANNEDQIEHIDSLTHNFALNAEPVTSIGTTNAGVIYTPQQVQFTAVIKTIGDTASRLTALALAGKRFDIRLQQLQGEDFAWEKIVLSDCIATQASLSASAAGPPVLTLSGFSLAASAEPNGGGGATVEVP